MDSFYRSAHELIFLFKNGAIRRCGGNAIWNAAAGDQRVFLALVE
jgi:hypothetical protein